MNILFQTMNILKGYTIIETIIFLTRLSLKSSGNYRKYDTNVDEADIDK